MELHGALLYQQHGRQCGTAHVQSGRKRPDTPAARFPQNAPIHSLHCFSFHVGIIVHRSRTDYDYHHSQMATKRTYPANTCNRWRIYPHYSPLFKPYYQQRKSNIFMWNTITLGILQLIAMLILSPYGLKTC